MQPLSGPGAPLPGSQPQTGSASGAGRPGSAGSSAAPGEQPLSPAQRTTLERLVVKLMAISPQKSAEVWAGIRHQVGLPNDGELQSRHFPAAEQFLNSRISDAQTSRGTRQLLQQLAELLPLGNNRQAVSDFIRQQFGQTVLSSLTPEQLHQVLSMLQNGQMAIPQPQQNSMTDRALLPAEHQALNQQIARLAAVTGQPAEKIWTAMLKMVDLKPGDPVPSRLFPLLTQYLQARQSLSQQNGQGLTLGMLIASLKQPPSHEEHQLLENAAQQQFQAQPQTNITNLQAQVLLDLLFSQRAERVREQRLADGSINPQPILSPIWANVPSFMLPALQRPMLSLFVAVVMIGFLMWIFL